jgi:hypothetical protein
MKSHISLHKYFSLLIISSLQLVKVPNTADVLRPLSQGMYAVFRGDSTDESMNDDWKMICEFE